MEDQVDRATVIPLFIDELLSELEQGDPVLDLGCGQGTFSYEKYPHLRISALDIVRPDVKLPDHVRFRLGTAQSLPYDDGTFRLVIAHCVFEHFPDFAGAIQEAERVLSLGGRLYMSVPDARSFEDQLYRATFAGGGHLQQPTLEWIIGQVYRNTGLKLICYTDWPAGMSFLGDHDEMRAFAFAVLNTVHQVTGQDLRAHSSYVLLFRREAGIGYRRVTRTCTYCGTGDGVDNPAAAGSAPGNWVCPACGRENRVLITPADVSPERLRTDVERFDAEFGGTLKAVPVPDQVGTALGVGGGVGLAMSTVELQELRWLVKWSLRFRSHLRFFDALRRLRRLTFG
jgi:SAM-dependent methyltransferase